MPTDDKTPSLQAVEYATVIATPAVQSLDALNQSVRAFSKDANAAIQQVGIWQRELRDAEFEDNHGDVRVRLHNCDQRQRAILNTLNELTSLLQRLRVNIADLSTDHGELAKVVTAPSAPGGLVDVGT